MDMVLPIEAYTITFDASGGGFEDGGTTITMTAPENETLTPPSVSHSEYAFTEWYSTDNKSFTAETSIKGDTTVYARWLVSIAVTSLPTKTAYFVGEVLDLNGLVVTGIYANNTTKTEIVSMDNISGYNADTTGQQTLTVTVNSKTATFSVTVHAITLVSIAITSPPIKTTYLTGEDLNLSGLEVTGTYTNNTTKTEVVSMDNVSGYDTNNEGQQTLIVTVDGKTASFTVTVNPASFTVYYYDDTVQAMNVYYWTDAGGGNLSMTDIGDGWFSAVVPSSIGMRFNDNYQQTVDLTRTHTGYFLPERTDIFGKIIGTWYGTKPSTEPGNQSYYYPGTGKTYAGFQGTKGKLATSYDEVTVTFPMETSFSADAFFTLEGRVKNPGSYNYALVKVEKNDNPDLTTSYWVRGVFKTRIWLRFGSGDYTVTVTRVSEVTAVGSPDGNPNGGAILGWRYYTSGNITFTVTNTQSGDGDARWIYPSAVVQSDDPLVTQTASTITAGLVSDRDKARAVHDYLVQNTVYDMVDYLDHSKHRKQDAVTVLETRYQEDSQYPGGHFLAVCEGYANTAAALLRAVGVKMKYIESTPMSHAWNNVYIGGYWKFMDVTWDDSVPDQGPTYTRYTYFLLDSLSGVNYDHYDYYDGTRVVRPAIPTQRGMPDGWY
jgi:hypothetical protein